MLCSKFNKYDEFIKKVKKDDPNIDSIKVMYQKYKKALEMINNKQFLSNTLKKVLALKEKYENWIQKVYGVVYVVRIKPEWFKNWQDPFIIKNIHLRTAHPEIFNNEINRNVNCSCFIIHIFR